MNEDPEKEKVEAPPPTTKKIHALDTRAGAEERTLCGLPLSTDHILWSIEVGGVTCRTCERLMGLTRADHGAA